MIAEADLPVWRYRTAYPKFYFVVVVPVTGIKNNKIILNGQFLVEVYQALLMFCSVASSL